MSPYLRRYESAVLHGQAAFREALRLRQEGFNPDLIVGHSGFGNTIYLKEVWPSAKFVGYFEWFYRSQGSDVGFGNNQPPSPDTSLRVHTYNSLIVMDSPSVMPPFARHIGKPTSSPAMRRNLSVIFDVVDTKHLPLVLQSERQQALNIKAGEAKANIPRCTPSPT